jgi:PmbA protein
MASQLQQEPSLDELAEIALASAKKHGAGSAAATSSESTSVEVRWRDGALERLSEATERALSVELFVDGRFSKVSTSDLRREAIDAFLADAVDLTRALAPDPHRGLPDPERYAGRSAADLAIFDAAVERVSPRERLDAARQLEEAARTVEGKDKIASVTGSWSDTRSELVRRASNGFSGTRRETSAYIYASVSVNDEDGKKPSDYAYAGGRFVKELPALAGVGLEAARRALRRIGQKKGKSELLPMVVENRTASRLPMMLMGPLLGSTLQQKMSFLDGQVGKPLGSKLLDLRDEPLLPRGLGSRHFDGEGMTLSSRPIFEAGTLRSFFIDTYYGRKLGQPATTGATTNLVLTPGDKDLAALLASMGEGIFVTGFLGGNSNGATGDYSLGIDGFRVRKGQLAEPIGEMNIGGNQRDLWNKLVAVGNDPWRASKVVMPSMLFDGVQFAGT